MPLLWELSRFDVLNIGFKSPGHLEVEIGVLLHKTGRETIEQAQKVMRYEDLSIAVRSSSDTNRWDLKLLGD